MKTIITNSYHGGKLFAPSAEKYQEWLKKDTEKKIQDFIKNLEPNKNGFNFWEPNSYSYYTYNLRSPQPYYAGTHYNASFHKLISYESMQYNANGERNTLKTALGEVEVFLDLFGDESMLEAGKITRMGDLFKFDSNQDGFLNKEDELFSKLKIKTSSGKTLNLGDVVGTLDLYSFVQGVDRTSAKEVKEWIKNNQNGKMDNTNRSLNGHLYDPYNDIRLYQDDVMKLFPPEQRYKPIKKEEIREMFDALADKDGWVNLRDPKINEALFASGEFITNFAYKKKNLAGVEVLEEFNIVDSLDNGSRIPRYKDTNIREYEEILRTKYGDNQSYESYYTELFNSFYEEYKKAQKDFNAKKEAILNDAQVSKDKKEQVASIDKSNLMMEMEQEFKNITGLEFSKEKLEELKEALNDPTKQKETIAKMSDLDSVTSMKLEDDGFITLRFSSGREIKVDTLYNDTGTLNITKKGDRATINLKAQSLEDEELNKLDFKEAGIKQGENTVSLQDIGAKMIEKIVSENGKFLGFAITTANDILFVDVLYNIYTLDSLNKNREFSVEF